MHVGTRDDLASFCNRNRGDQVKALSTRAALLPFQSGVTVPALDCAVLSLINGR